VIFTGRGHLWAVVPLCFEDGCDWAGHFVGREMGLGAERWVQDVPTSAFFIGQIWEDMIQHEGYLILKENLWL